MRCLAFHRGLSLYDTYSISSQAHFKPCRTHATMQEKKLIGKRSFIYLVSLMWRSIHNKKLAPSRTPALLFRKMKLLIQVSETRVLVKIRVLIKSRRRIREEVVNTLLEANLKTSILSLVSMNDVEAAIGFRAKLPYRSLT